METKKIKVMTVVGTRPEIIKLCEVIKELDKHTDHVLVHTGQNYDYELNEIFFKDLGLRKPDYFLDAAGKNGIETVGNVIIKIDKLILQEKPDAFLILGDTNSALSVYSAKRRKIPIFHMEAGNRSFDARVPEEVNRKVVDHVSDINIVYSDITRDNLIREGLPIDRIIKSGATMFEVLEVYKHKIEASKILNKLHLQKRKYFVLTLHREENIDSEKNFNSLIKIIETVSEKYKLPIIFSAHPRTQKRLAEKNIKLPKEVRLMKPMGFFDFVKLQKNSLCVLTDSGTISIESPILNFPGLNLRDAHERNEAMDEAAVVMTGLNPERVLQALEVVKNQHGAKREFKIPEDYMVPNVSKKILRIILSYTDYVKRTVWQEQ
ncbi:MAG: UDP-N-acetylglucosamine 2-epimerase [Candidatus Woesebacteria bacterium GW2011_GWA1_39_8]|uniref:UDP-N-acetylglucosamine 2-epimerase n=1 Tax=Candidatus Woesebacteria bacterium GW2011_GWA1_39_8 TaxID=1618552 RepID=A0A0G0PNG5_9BACT|nr:MAG: UDP-N-acetylglucosamine 2-epimerase [Candidatus Woesebacteria bacterium GW2011_GWA1_39_8]